MASVNYIILQSRISSIYSTSPPKLGLLELAGGKNRAAFITEEWIPCGDSFKYVAKGPCSPHFCLGKGGEEDPWSLNDPGSALSFINIFFKSLQWRSAFQDSSFCSFAPSPALSPPNCVHLKDRVGSLCTAEPTGEPSLHRRPVNQWAHLCVSVFAN